VIVREVGPRDGLQSERPVPPADRANLVTALISAGCRRIEAVSFVSERAVPAMAGAAGVLERLDPAGRSSGGDGTGDASASRSGTWSGSSESVVSQSDRLGACRITALVPNVRGAEAALAAGVDELTVTVAASPVYNERNVHRSIDESVSEIGRICELAGHDRIPVDVVISCAFGSPYEGDIDSAEVAALSERARMAGADEVTLADTTGMATPRVLGHVLAATGTGVGLHLHETRGTGLVNAYAALLLGVRRFDTSIGGLGGSPFADGAGGNLATEDFVALLDDLGVSTGIVLDELLTVSALARDLVGHELPSRVATAGPRTRLSAPTA
jgi:hydroxymethylglutaryl-CoA lyase